MSERPGPRAHFRCCRLCYSVRREGVYGLTRGVLLSSLQEVVDNYGACGNRRHHQLALKAQALRDHKWFQTSIILVIFLASVLVGIQTYDVTNQSVLDVVGYAGVAQKTAFLEAVKTKS